MSLSPEKQLFTKKQIAQRYGVSPRTITSWMRRRIIPFSKPSVKLVRFDPIECDIAFKTYEHRSVFDSTIREEIERRAAQREGRPFTFEKELGLTTGSAPDQA